MDDTIYRRDAINAMIEDKIPKEVPLITNTAGRDFEVFNSACDRHAKIIGDLPSAQPDWDEMIVICDCCGHTIHVQRQYAERKERDGNG